jgi:phosphopantothenoylcysteine decarboxylase/phosphopantothenate--cysteine ligase
MGGHEIVLGVTGSVACYKAADVASRLAQSGVDVNVVMTRSACEFVTPLTFQSVTRRAVATDQFAPIDDYDPAHISLCDRASLILVAPATANIIGKIASGIADDLLSTLVMAFDGPVLIAPAMNVKMWNNRILRENVSKLKGLGFKFIGPDSGHLACGDKGEGRLSEPAGIVTAVLNELKNSGKPGRGGRGKGKA